MKKLTLLFAALFSVSLAAQTIEFAPPGAVWTYVYSYWPTWQGPEVVEIVELRYSKDTVINGTHCKLLALPNRAFHIYQEGQKVFYKPDTASQFQVLYDFSLHTGESFPTPVLPASMLTEVDMLCTARDTVSVNGTTLPRLQLDAYCGSSQFFTTQVTPRFGPLDYTFLFYTWYTCLFDFGETYHLCSYRDNNLAGIYQVENTSGSCTLDATSPGFRVAPFKASPNPTSDWLTISWADYNDPDLAFRLVSATTGQTVYQNSDLQGKSALVVPVNDLVAGHYMAVLASKSKAARVVKVVVSQ